MTERDVRKMIAERAGSQIFMQPIESPGTALGIPDLYLRTVFHSYWTELKIVSVGGRLLSKPYVAVPFRPGQRSWLRRYYLHYAGRSLLIAGWKDDEWMVSVFLNDGIREIYSRMEFDMLPVYRASYATFSPVHFLRAVGDH